MHEGLIWLFHPKPQGAAQPHRRSRDSHFPPINLSVWFSVWLSSFPSPPHLFCMGAAKHPREHTYTQKKPHISIHSCRAVRSNLDSHREWIVMQTGGRGGHKQDVRELLLVSARPASFFPVESDAAQSLCYRYFFLSPSPLAGPQQLPFPFPLSTKQIPGVWKAKWSLEISTSGQIMST